MQDTNGQRAPESENLFFATFAIKQTDRTIGIREHCLADGNFLITYFIKRILNGNGNRMCLVNFHHTLTHYQSIGKRLNFDMISRVKSGDVTVIEPMKRTVENFSHEKGNYGRNITKDLILKIKDAAGVLAENKSGDGEIYLVIDDVSHLLDLGIELKDAIAFLNCCVNLPVIVVALTHVSNKTDVILGNALCYIADVYFDVLPLKTGVSRDVTGVLKCRRQEDAQEKDDVYHFKAMEKEVRIFLPGEVMHLFYK